jgi:hypothetical protein
MTANAEEDLQKAALLDIFTAKDVSPVISPTKDISTDFTVAPDISGLVREDIDKLHTVHMEALGHLERVVLALSVSADSAPAVKDAKKSDILCNLLDTAKKLMEDVVTSAKVLAHATIAHNQKAMDAIRRSSTSIGKAVHEAHSECVKAKREHAAQKAAIKDQKAQISLPQTST